MRSTFDLRLLLASLVCSLALLRTASAIPATEDGLLMARGNAGVGKRCSASPQCKTGLYCKRGSCSAKRDVGGPCYKNNGCISGKCVKSRCAATSTPTLLPVGSKCSTSAACASGYCGRSKCAAKLADGEACYKDNGCTSGKCTNGKCGAGTTAPTNPPVIVAGNRVSNPSFEDGTLSAYTTKGDVSIGSAPGAAYDGTYYAILKSAQGVTASLGQSTSVKRAITNSYQVKFQYRVRALSGSTSRPFCYIAPAINGLAEAAAEPDFFYAAVNQTGWTEYNKLLQSEPTINSIEIFTFCNSVTTATFDVDALSYVQDLQGGHPNNINNVGNLIMNAKFGEYANPGAYWSTEGNVQFTDAGYPVYTVNQKNNYYALLTAPSGGLSAIYQNYNVYPVDGVEPYGISPGFVHFVSSFSRSASTPDAVCRLRTTMNGIAYSDDIVIDAASPDNGPDETYFIEHNTISGTFDQPGLDRPFRLEVNCDQGAQASVRLDHTAIFAGRDK
ncbi:hypothetical protein IE81DRAFT_319300 [Ceraceosorus guamensis]|uniref:Uncharacterized protein n=1 Tax=Ceraceosorus guamensis TaxID=1522189 RepID=A0A316W980_9BASI|nr:hypothetical protein IE81DRAFT_319300 [Ceraceosorus guamensis]PWN46392.1 hypothetical protein IE81DRAFT_319300 [Ceraceosorus guamensis]